MVGFSEGVTTFLTIFPAEYFVAEAVGGILKQITKEFHNRKTKLPKISEYKRKNPFKKRRKS